MDFVKHPKPVYLPSGYLWSVALDEGEGLYLTGISIDCRHKGMTLRLLAEPAGSGVSPVSDPGRGQQS